MPTYTPVTRGDQRPQAPEPPQPAYSPYGASPQPAPSHPSPAPLTYPSSYPSSAPSQPSSYPAAAPSYQNAQPAPAPSYQNSHPAAAPSYQSAQPAATPSYPDFQTQAYRGANQQVHAPGFPGAEHAGPQSYPAPSYNGAQGFPSQPYGDQNFADASSPEPSTPDASFPETSFADQNFADTNFANQSFGNQSFADASFPEPQSFDASFPDASYPSNSDFAHQEQPSHDNGYTHPLASADQGFETFTEEATQDYVMGAQSAHLPESDPRRQLQAFDAIYDQPPQIALGSTDQTRRPPQDFYEGERADADFLDEGQAIPPPGARSKMGMTIRGRSAFMVGSALLGAIALGGALAFAYKQSGGGMSSETPPLVQADNRPVKELPAEAGGKEFPHKNKLIYDRLQNGDEPEAERLVPRQEDVAVPALPQPTLETAGMPAPVASTDLVSPQTTQAVDTPAGGEPVAVASIDDSAPDGGPRRVKTMVVRPDGSVMAPPEPVAAPGEAAPGVAEAPADMQLAAAGPPPAEAVAAPPPAAEPAAETPPPPAVKPQQVAAVQPAPVKPKVAKPAVQTAAAAPAAGTKFVVQVGSKKSQTDALASFADMQQKYPSLLGSYRPMVQKADLGAKGTWYRLRIGPIADKTAATKLCGQLKSQGHPDCLVSSQ